MKVRALAFRVATGVAIAAIAQPAYARDEQAWDKASTIGRGALVAAALAVPAVQGDWKGDLQAGASIGSAALVTMGLKEAFPEWRPDHSNQRSFPSRHTSTACAAAASLQNRYGWKVGLPAQLVAAFVGVARIQARKHHWYDVAAGAVIGETAGFLLTSKHSSAVRVLPWGDTKGAGVVVAVNF
jgi:membrane-associated phospholipid phosphatase